MAYTKVNWTESTPISASNLAKMDEGIYLLQQSVKVLPTTFEMQKQGVTEEQFYTLEQRIVAIEKVLVKAGLAKEV